jgi:hypothetical protein
MIKAIVYDACMLIGAGLVVAGVAKTFGTGPALMVAGGLMIGLTIRAAR